MNEANLENDLVAGEIGDANPVERDAAINAWHAALARIIAYAWENWNDDEELENIVLYPDYYLKEYGFDSQIPAYKTKVKFVIKKDDKVKFTHGDQKQGGSIAVETNSGQTQVQKMGSIPTYESENGHTADIKSIKTIRSEYNESPMTDKVSFEEYLFENYISDENSCLENGWNYKDLSDLTGCFIVAIPPKPEDGAHDLQALNDFMELCCNQPFTCA